MVITNNQNIHSLNLNPNVCDRSINDVLVVYEYETEELNESNDLPIDGLLLNGCSRHIFKFSIIVLPIVFLSGYHNRYF